MGLLKNQPFGLLHSEDQKEQGDSRTEKNKIISDKNGANNETITRSE